MNLLQAAQLAGRRGKRKGDPRTGRLADAAGRNFEIMVRSLSRGQLFLPELPRAGSRYVRGVGFVPQKMPCDFIGWYRGDLRPICFDAKSTDHLRRFTVSMLTDDQKRFLIDAGEAGATSGVLIESRAKGLIFWLAWKNLRPGKPSFAWDEMPAVGSICAINFQVLRSTNQ